MAATRAMIKIESSQLYSVRWGYRRKLSSLINPSLLPLIQNFLQEEIQRREKNGEIHCFDIKFHHRQFELHFSLESKYYPGPDQWIEEFYLYTSILAQEKFNLPSLWE